MFQVFVQGKRNVLDVVVVSQIGHTLVGRMAYILVMTIIIVLLAETVMIRVDLLVVVAVAVAAVVVAVAAVVINKIIASE